jgi:hypothetical protein
MTAPADGDRASAGFDITSIVIDEYAERPRSKASRRKQQKSSGC